MKKLLIFMLSLVTNVSLYAQDVTAFFQSQGGVQDLGGCAHPTNTYDHGTFYVESNFVIVDVYYKDVNFNGKLIHTQIRLGRGFGSLYFNSIYTIYDNDYVRPFVAFGFGSALMAELIQKVNPKKYNEVRQNMIQLIGTDPNGWNGAGWALFAMNLDFVGHYTSD